MTQYTAAVIGTGADPDDRVWGESAAMAYFHGDAYQAIPNCDLAACADIVRENAEAFAEEYDVPDANVFEDYEEMLRTVEPDVVSITTPVPTHADLVVGAAETGAPGAIHCEKPMAHTWGECQRAAAAADEHGVQLTYNHQRRFAPAWREAKRLLDDGAIGDLQRVEMGGKNLYDYGTHFFDLCNHFAGEHRPEWILGQVHYEREDVRYGVHNENQALATWSYPNGVTGLAGTGFGTGAEAIGCAHRLVGDAGAIEVHPDGVDADLRYRGDGDGWHARSFDERDLHKATLEHVLDCVYTDETPVVSAAHALRATEPIFAAWESARRRGRVDLPLDAEGNALTEMVDDGTLTPVADE
ncbi:Predicted dehydrogenase [Natronoarchaeum philippinense]|uniref:Predicted dehydrogenase n=1 Tax=Natronoarchaeum philippinense TaxID=558529 RepID=A0A285P5M8_NATPI|nr:Gfo/Idh/MocA family oxidoreductase [Natronoarchaeum philippinense]SNZ17042.1 Predicted dehydrogenase [Natronoarchaeum philippinense]